ncbi:hypothetical protein [Planococcus wigleyi]|uniref:Uncharacterized protein n=1 Tax=Planococcus wigleyi TaxID=2762216 RepID=A0ABR8WBT5_9BACL|nr:hypothetical protein [Planococcus wigleyi]MBD8014490.1 hypothetical protein [Planococcus wigleyi]
MRGNRKVNLEMVNSHFNLPKSIHFLYADSHDLEKLYSLCKEFSKEIWKSYEHEVYLKETFSELRRTINRFFTSIENYSVTISRHLKDVLNLLKSLKSGYPIIFENYCIPLAASLKKIQEDYGEINFLQNSIREKIATQINGNTYILTRFQNGIDHILINGYEVPVLRANDFINKNIFADNIIFIGSPYNFEEKFSTLFFAKTIYFINYKMFENQLRVKSNFNNLGINATYNSIYENVSINKGLLGEKMEFGIDIITEVLDEDEVLKDYRMNNKVINEIDKIETRVIFLANKCYIFVPVLSKIRKLDKVTGEFFSAELKSIENDDLLLFRNNSSVDLIVEVANVIMGEKASIYRKYQNIWKKTLRGYIKKYGAKKFALYLRNRGIPTANEVNLRNWISPENIAPNHLVELLTIFQYSPERIEKIVISTKKIKSAHLRAGIYISKKLLEELNEDLLEGLEDEGYVTFSSELFKGASFNIEIVKNISEKVMVIDRKDVLKIFRG